MIDKNPLKINQLFNEIASYYDKMNILISFGMHYLIKKRAIKLLNIKQNSKILDLCTGTGDIVQIISKKYKNIDIIGIDNSKNMLKIAKSKNKKINFICADIKNIPLKNSEFDYITIAFGLRNIDEREKALKEIKRLLKPNGLLLHLDFGNHNISSKFFDFFVLMILKILKINAKNYKYLIKSKNEYPEPDELIKEFNQNGFNLVTRKDFLFGAISTQVLIYNL